MLQVFRTSPVLIIQVALLLMSAGVLTSMGLLLARTGASLRPIYWLFGLVLLISGPQFAASLFLALETLKSATPRFAALEQLATSRDGETRLAAAKLLFGPDADPQLVTDARSMFNDVFATAQSALFAALPNADSVLLARFKSASAAEKAWVAYLRVTGLGQMGGVGDSQRGYSITRPGQDRAYALPFGNMVGIWTGRDDAAIRRRMLAGGFAIPRRAPLAADSAPDARVSKASFPPGLAALLVTLNLAVVIIYFFKGSAWAGTHRAEPGTTPVPANELTSRLETINALQVPFQIERGSHPAELLATCRYADAKWIDLARARGLKRTFQIRLNLDDRTGTVRATDYTSSFDWSAGLGGAGLEWKAGLGIVFFQYEHQRTFGLQLDDQGRFKPDLSYAYTFNLQEMKAPLITAVTRAGWNWRPTIWQGPRWLRWLTE